MNTLNGKWNYPTTVFFGAGIAADIAQHCGDLGIQQPLLVTDRGLAEHDLVVSLKKSLDEAQLPCAIFADIKPNPVGENITAGVEAFRQHQADGVVAVGGGSALDAAKAIALMVAQSRPLWDFEDCGDNWLRVNPDGMAPLIALPTTSGTGSEVGRASVITHEEAHRKVIIFHPDMLPDRVLADPALTRGLPAALTAATGMDALSHNIEAYCAPGFHPMADGIALEGIRLVHEALPQAVQNGENIEARSLMMAASTMGATAFQKGLGGIHALAHPLGAVYDAHHGLLNAILMPYVLIANREVLDSKMTRLARYLNLTQPGFDAVLHWILDLRKQINIPNSLELADIHVDDPVKIANMAIDDPSAGGNPIVLSVDNYTRILEDAMTGRLAV